MKTRILRSAVLAALTVTVAAGCGNQGSAVLRVDDAAAPPAAVQPASTPSADIATLTGTSRLADVAAACARTAGASQAGAVVIEGRLVDAGATVDIDVPCAIQLGNAAEVSLTNVTVHSKTLNLSDTAMDEGVNVVTLKHVAMSGGQGAGLLIELTDPDDHVVVNDSSLDYAAGVVIQASGARTLPDHGGFVEMHGSRLRSAPDGEGLSLGASSGGGKVVVTDSEFLSDQVSVVADECSVQSGPKRLDCSAAHLGDVLKEQANASGDTARG